MTIQRVSEATLTAFHRMRAQLYPATRPESIEEVRALLCDPDFVFLVAVERERVLGFAEGAIRHEYVNGCETSPVVFLEGIYVDAAFRGSGVARALVNAVADWGRAGGCIEFASDTPIENTESRAMHRALGFEETERVVYFKKTL